MNSLPQIEIDWAACRKFAKAFNEDDHTDWLEKFAKCHKDRHFWCCWGADKYRFDPENNTYLQNRHGKWTACTETDVNAAFNSAAFLIDFSQTAVVHLYLASTGAEQVRGLPERGYIYMGNRNVTPQEQAAIIDEYESEILYEEVQDRVQQTDARVVFIDSADATPALLKRITRDQ